MVVGGPHAQADLEFWTDEAKLSDPALGHYIGPIRDALLPQRDRMVFLKDGQDIVPGAQALSTPGHTVGHTSFVISSQGRSGMFLFRQLTGTRSAPDFAG